MSRLWRDGAARGLGALGLMIVACIIGSIASVARVRAEPAATAVAPADVFARVAVLRAELERIRVHLRAPTDLRPALDVRDATPREVYFQARTVALKADRFAFEQARRRLPLLDPKPVHTIDPADVRAVIDDALIRIRLVKTALGIAENARERAAEVTHTPTDVYRSIVQASRQLNLLLRHEFGPDDVYTQVTVGISLAARLLSLCPGQRRISDTPALQPKRRSADVYRRLLLIYNRLRVLAMRHGVTMLHISIPTAQQSLATPSDVYHVASLVVSGLAHLHDLAGTLRPPIAPYYPGVKQPSHVFQRGQILANQIERLDLCLRDGKRWFAAK